MTPSHSRKRSRSAPAGRMRTGRVSGSISTRPSRSPSAIARRLASSRWYGRDPGTCRMWPAGRHSRAMLDWTNLLAGRFLVFDGPGWVWEVDPASSIRRPRGGHAARRRPGAGRHADWRGHPRGAAGPSVRRDGTPLRDAPLHGEPIPAGQGTDPTRPSCGTVRPRRSLHPVDPRLSGHRRWTRPRGDSRGRSVATRGCEPDLVVILDVDTEHRPRPLGSRRSIAWSRRGWRSIAASGRDISPRPSGIPLAIW